MLKLKLLIYIFIILGVLQDAIFHTSYFDVDLDKSFKSCANGKKLLPALWKYNEPNNFNREEPCAVIGLKSLQLDGMFDVTCAVKSTMRVICEVRPLFVYLGTVYQPAENFIDVLCFCSLRVLLY
jgi:hypothetical protein